MNLFVDAPPDKDDLSESEESAVSEGDASDSESSQYSELEDEDESMDSVSFILSVIYKCELSLQHLLTSKNV